MPENAVNPLDRESVRPRVEQALRGFLDHQRTVLAQVGPECLPLLERVEQLVEGGKRFRPVLLYWGWRGAGGADDGPVVAAAASLELFQAAALIHDDVMDGADARRGRPSVHRAFEASHREGRLSGDPQRFGQSAAILTGDLCQAWADEMFHRCGLPEAALARGRVPFDRMRTHLMAGQYLDLFAQAVADDDPVAAERRARHLIQFKSARYSVVEPLLIGASSAGAPQPVLAGLERAGAALGEAFQLRDDLLGVFGDPATTGKPAGDDLREGKRTVLVARTLALAAPDDAALVRAGLGRADLDEHDVARLRSVITGCGAAAALERLIDDLAGLARAELAGLGLAAPADEVLDGLVTALTDRPA